MEADLEKVPSPPRIKLAVDLLRMGLPDVKEDEALVQIEDALKLIGGCCVKKQGEGKHGPEESKEVAETLSNCGTAKVFFNLMSELRASMSKKTWPCMMALRMACITLTDAFDSFCLDLCSAGFMVIFRKELKLYSKVSLEQNVSYVC